MLSLPPWPSDRLGRCAFLVDCLSCERGCNGGPYDRSYVDRSKTLGLNKAENCHHYMATELVEAHQEHLADQEKLSTERRILANRLGGSLIDLIRERQSHCGRPCLRVGAEPGSLGGRGLLGRISAQVHLQRGQQGLGRVKIVVS